MIVFTLFISETSSSSVIDAPLLGFIVPCVATACFASTEESPLNINNVEDDDFPPGADDDSEAEDA